MICHTPNKTLYNCFSFFTKWKVEFLGFGDPNLFFETLKQQMWKYNHKSVPKYMEQKHNTLMHNKSINTLNKHKKFQWTVSFWEMKKNK